MDLMNGNALKKQVSSQKQPFRAFPDDIGSKPFSKLVFDLPVKLVKNIG